MRTSDRNRTPEAEPSAGATAGNGGLSPTGSPGSLPYKGLLNPQGHPAATKSHGRNAIPRLPLTSLGPRTQDLWAQPPRRRLRRLKIGETPSRLPKTQRGRQIKAHARCVACQPCVPAVPSGRLATASDLQQAWRNRKGDTVRPLLPATGAVCTDVS